MEELVCFSGGEALLHQHTGYWQDTPLDVATVNARVDSVKTLIKLGANLAAR